MEVLEPFTDDPESLVEELDSLFAVLDSLVEELERDSSDALDRAFEPWSFL
ncbi:MAG: hypothetical protein OXF75_12750 [Acidimicrobiaceae bacterium]|nr:hypothetical protein [Acidimicrobiaceae bacterium]